MDSTRTDGVRGRGSIALIIGPMFSEKTTSLVARVRRASYANRAGVIVKYRGDRRYEAGPVVASHAETRQASSSGCELRAGIRVVEAETLAEVRLEDHEVVVGVDEGQFFADLNEQSERWANAGRDVVVAALDGDYLRRPFGTVCALVPLCESVEKLSGVCMGCRKRPSAFTQRLGGGEAVVQIGAGESYRAVCRECYPIVV